MMILMMMISMMSREPPTRLLRSAEVQALLLPWTLTVMVVVLAVVALALALHARRRALLDLPRVPGPPVSWIPLVGSLPALLRPDFHRQVLAWADIYGGIYRLRGLWYDGLVVTDPVVLAAICGRGEGALDKATPLYLAINQMCSPRGHQNLLTASAGDPAWRAVRKAVAAAFSVVNIRKKAPVVQAAGRKLVTQLAALAEAAEAAGPSSSPLTVDVDQMALRVTLDVIGLAGFGHDFGCLRAGSLTGEPAAPDHLLRVMPRCFTEVMRRMVNPMRALLPAWFAKGARGEAAFAAFQAEMRVLLREMLERPTPPAVDDVSIGAQLWRAFHDAGGCEAPGAHPTLPSPPGRLTVLRWRLQELAWALAGGGVPSPADHSTGKADPRPLLCPERLLSEIGILFVEGFETTGHTIGWTLLHIATAPGVQDAVAAELDTLGLLARPGGVGLAGLPEVGVEVLHRLPYLTACIKEAMRMLPVVSVMARKVGSDRPARVGPYLVPPDTPIAIPLFAIHNTAANWEAPNEFRPDRWLRNHVSVESYVVGAPLPLSGDGGRTAADSTGVRGGDGLKRPAGAPIPPAPMVRFMPFSEGPRNCVGQTLAKLEVVTVLAQLLGAFHMTLAPEMGGLEGVRSRESTHLTLQLRGTQGIRMRLRPRWLAPAPAMTASCEVAKA